MSSEAKIADIKRQLGEAVQRIETIQTGQPLLTRIASHLKTQSGSIVNVVLTASLFAVAIGRLHQKQQHEAERQDWQEKEVKLDLDRQRLAQQVTGLQRQLLQLTAGVQRELTDGGYRLAPVRSRLQQMLADFPSTAGLPATSQLQTAAQNPAAGMLPQPSNSLSPAPQLQSPSQPDKHMMI
ncbi:hypothetical protein ABBQ38_009406 [Trebouxia sp. C0009 RCD-2024]